MRLQATMSVIRWSILRKLQVRFGISIVQQDDDRASWRSPLSLRSPRRRFVPRKFFRSPCKVDTTGWAWTSEEGACGVDGVYEPECARKERQANGKIHENPVAFTRHWNSVS